MVRHFTLSVVNLTNANLRGSDLTQVVLGEVDLAGAQYNEDDLPTHTDSKLESSFYHKITPSVDLGIYRKVMKWQLPLSK